MAVFELEVLAPIERVEVISSGRSLRELPRLIAAHGPGRWRKLKDGATVRLPDGVVVAAEVHWYEAHGIGRKELKIKRLLRR